MRRSQTTNRSAPVYLAGQLSFTDEVEDVLVELDDLVTDLAQTAGRIARVTMACPDLPEDAAAAARDASLLAARAFDAWSPVKVRWSL